MTMKYANLTKYLLIWATSAFTLFASTSREDLETKALSGDADAQFELSNALLTEDYHSNLSRAIILIKAAAEGGNSDAQARLGWGYLNQGSSLKPDVELGFKWLNRSAEAGNVNALNYLGMAYRYGTSEVRADPPKSYPFFLKAAEKGDKESQYNVGTALIYGIGTDVDVTRGVKYLNQSAEAGYASSQHLLGVLSFSGELGVKPDYEAGRMWLEKSVAQDFAMSAIYLAQQYMTGARFPADPNKARQLLERASQKGSTQADVALGMFYLQGYSGGPNPTKGYAYIKAAADKKNPAALGILGTAYAEGDYYPKDTQKGVQLLREAVKLGDTGAAVMLAELYLRDIAGSTVTKEEIKGYLRGAAASGSQEAMSQLMLLQNK